MKITDIISRGLLCLMILVVLDYLPVYAQKQRTKVTIIKETYDEHGNKTVQTIIKEGDEADAIDLDQLGSSPDKNSSLQWRHFDLDSFPMGNDFFNFSLKDPLDLRSLLDSFGFGHFQWEDGLAFPDKFGFETPPGSGLKLGVQIKELESQAGVLITEVLPGTPAEEAGLSIGDIILSLDDKKVSSVDEVTGYIRSLSGENVLEIHILRDGKYLTKKAAFTARKKDPPVRKI